MMNRMKRFYLGTSGTIFGNNGCASPSFVPAAGGFAYSQSSDLPETSILSCDNPSAAFCGRIGSSPTRHRWIESAATFSTVFSRVACDASFASLNGSVASM